MNPLEADPEHAFDPVRFKANQREVWGRAARGWERWWETFERAAQSVSDRLVELAAVGPGQRVLDVATGIGEPAVTAARRVGPRGRVLAVDQAPQMLAVARRRMASLGLTNLELMEADVEALETTERFDGILCRWGLMFLPDLDAALARLVRMLVPGGRLAAAVWGEPERVPLATIAREVLMRALPAQPAPGTPTPFDLADEAALRRRLERAGLEEVGSEWWPVTFEFDSASHYARFVREVSSAAPALEELPRERQDEVWAAVADAARPYADPAGRVRLENHALLVWGARPSAAGGRPSEGIADRADASRGAVSAGTSPDRVGQTRRDEPRAQASARGAEAAARLESGRPAVPCPFCGGTDTRLESLFGSTLGFSQYWCERCRTVFEYLKWEEPG